MDPLTKTPSTPPSLADISRTIRGYTAVRQPDDSFYYGTEVSGLTFVRAEAPTGPLHSLHPASICMIGQGAKSVGVGGLTLAYEPGEYLVIGVESPAVGRIVQASAARPFLGLMLDLDPALLFAVARESGVALGAGGESAVFVGRLTLRAADALARLVALVETPEAIPALASAVTRELAYWLLTGPDGPAFARLAMPDGHARRVARAVVQMKARFPSPVRVGDLAAAAEMSVSSFHAHFKTLTGATPLQYYKRLRLIEARRLVTAEGASARDAAYRMGYESPSQFSREYARTFGVSPGRDGGRAVSGPARTEAR